MKTTKVIDISRVISNDSLVFPGDDQIGLATLCDIGPDCPCRVTKLENLTTHSLTHVDSPRHFLENGVTLDDIPLLRFMGKSLVVEAREDAITGKFVRSLELPRGINVLFKTRHSGLIMKGQFDEKHVHITDDGAEALVKAGVNLVGIDYLSVDRFGDDKYPAHYTLLGADVLILEAADFSNVAPGKFNLIALPLKIHEGDGSPVRAVLCENND